MLFHDLPTLKIVQEMCYSSLEKIELLIEQFSNDIEMKERLEQKKQRIHNLLKQAKIEIEQKEKTL